MSTPLKPPARLIDDPGTSSLVRADLENVAGAAPGYDAAAGLIALQAALGTGAAVSASAAHASTTHASAALATKSALGLKLAVLGGVGALAIASAVVILQPAPKSAAPAAKPAAAKVLAPPPPVVAPVVTPPQLIEPASVVAPVSALAPRQSASPRDRAAAEIAQLAQIKAAVESAPARALRLAEQGHRRFGEGYLHHEREGLAIVALHELGRQSEARVRAERFLVRYPHSSLSDRVRALQTEAGER